MHSADGHSRITGARVLNKNWPCLFKITFGRNINLSEPTLTVTGARHVGPTTTNQCVTDCRDTKTLIVDHQRLILAFSEISVDT